MNQMIKLNITSKAKSYCLISSAKQIQALSLPENYVGVSTEMLDNVLALASEKAERKN